MKESRVKNSFFNVSALLIEYILKLILTFAIRTVFIKKLGAEFLGLEGLFTNILQIMSISELGIGSAIVFSLYKPLVNKDEAKINTLMHLYRKCYFFIGIFIAVAGLILMPFLPSIINSSYNFGNVYLLFFLYLLQTLSTYWVLAYKESLLTADQKKYKVVIISNIIIFAKFILEIISLIVFKSFILYIVSGIITNVLRNLLIARLVDKNYPYAKKYNNIKLPKEEKKELVKNVTGLSLYKVSSTIMNSTDNIIISIYISLVTTGIYSNYLLIVTNLKNILNTLFSSMTASVGNLFAEGDKKRSEFIFRCLSFLNFWIYGFAAICLWELLNPFIEIWIGKDYIFNNYIVFIIVLNFITDGLQRTVLIYKDACGLFWKGKLRPVFSALSNIILSIIFVQWWGIFGVLLASVVSRMITTWWFDPYLVYHHALNESSKSYYINYFKYLFVVIIVSVLIDVLFIYIPLSGLVLFITKLIACLIIPNIIFFVLFRKTEEFDYLKDILLRKLKKKKVSE